MSETSYRLAVDIGGTFTDLVAFDESTGELMNYKVPSTPRRPVDGVTETIREFVRERRVSKVSMVIHATTIAANALLGQKGLELPKVALVTTNGFKDVIEIGRQKRPELYNLFVQRPKPLVPRRMRFEVQERLGPKGEVWTPLREESIDDVAEQVARSGAESVAICLLHSYANPQHELRVKEVMQRRSPEVFLSISSEVAPEHREYERTSTTVVNAALVPITSGYIEELRKEVNRMGVSPPLRIMQSNGGVAGEELVKRRPMSIIESGPAAGVIASAFYGRVLGIRNIISFDMGGTTAKAGTVRKYEPEVVSEYEVAGKVHSGRIIKGSGYPVRFPFIDLAECSAGGGTIAWVDEGGALRVGPVSAGAEPGPACYDMGGVEPTVTDANLILGRLNAEFLVGGRMRVSRKAAEKALRERVCDKCGLSEVEAASGIISIVNSAMAKILRIVSVERGYDPTEFTMLAFGGAGPMHACKLAEDLSIKKVVVPKNPGLFSAFGLLATDFTHNLVRGMLQRTDGINLTMVNKIFGELRDEGESMLKLEGVEEVRMKFSYYLDMRYSGQAYELRVPIGYEVNEEVLGYAIKEFHEKHQSVYGYSVADEAVEVVSLRFLATGEVDKPSVRKVALGGREPNKDACLAIRRAYFEAGREYIDCPVFIREKLMAGNVVNGPAIIEQFDCTTVVDPGWSAHIDAYQNIVLGAK